MPMNECQNIIERADLQPFGKIQNKNLHLFLKKPIVKIDFLFVEMAGVGSD